MSSHDRRLLFIHIVELVGLNGATLQHFGIKHIAAAEVSHESLQCVVHN
jgi:hypothetical protein